MSDVKRCLNCGETKPDVRPRTSPDRSDFKTFDRCDDCQEKRLNAAYRTMSRYPEAFSDVYRDDW